MCGCWVVGIILTLAVESWLHPWPRPTTRPQGYWHKVRDLWSGISPQRHFNRDFLLISIKCLYWKNLLSCWSCLQVFTQLVSRDHCLENKSVHGSPRYYYNILKFRLNFVVGSLTLSPFKCKKNIFAQFTKIVVCRRWGKSQSPIIFL